MSRRAVISAFATSLIAAPALIRPSSAQILQFSGKRSGTDWSAIDGSRNAPAGAATQLPTQLNQYVLSGPTGRFPGNGVQPPWEVAGCDYPVGTRTPIASLTPITSYSPPTGVSLDSTNRLVRISNTAGNVTISGFNFNPGGLGTANAWSVYNSSSGTITVDDCYFNGGGVTNRFDAPPDQSFGAVITYCVFDGSGISAVDYNRFVYHLGSGPLTMQYCLSKNINNHCLEFDPNGTGNLTLQWNLWDQFTGGGDGNTTCELILPFPPGVHQNWLQMLSGTSVNDIIEFQTYVQNLGFCGGQGVQLSGVNNTMRYCTLMCYPTGPAGGPDSVVTRMIDPGSAGIFYTGQISNLFIDRSGAMLSQGNGVFHQGTAFPPTVTGCIDMITGLPITYSD